MTYNPTSGRRATAPYNFIPLNDDIIEAATLVEKNSLPALPPRDLYDLKRKTGYFEVDLKTLTPLYIRAPLPLGKFDENQKQRRAQDATGKPSKAERDNIDFFYTHKPDGKGPHPPVIPGSSLLGPLRNVVQIAGFGKLQQTSNKRLYMRDINHKHYTGLTRNRVKQGFLKYKNNKWYVAPCTGVARVAIEPLPDGRDNLLGAFKLTHVRDLYELDGNPVPPDQAQNPNLTPKQTYQRRSCWVTYTKAPLYNKDRKPVGWQNRVDRFLLVDPHDRAYTKGTLVLTGRVQRQKRAWVFFDRTSAYIPLSEGTYWSIHGFNHESQRTDWQKSAYPPEGKAKDGDPVFFFLDKNTAQVQYIGRSQLMRIPMTQTPQDLLPDDHKDNPETIDFAEALFGYVRDRAPHTHKDARQGNPALGYAGRVQVTAAHPVPDNKVFKADDWFEPPLSLHSLESPKPSAYQLYLKQTSDNRKTLNYYKAGVSLRGFKRYWVKPGTTRAEIAFPEAGAAPNDLERHTKVRPVKTGKTFRFRIYFENLTKKELGALCWALAPANDPNRYVHTIGMGKPLGMGAVRLSPKLYVTDLKSRYTSLFDNEGKWVSGDVAEQMETYITAFEHFISPKLTNKNFRTHPRIKDLLTMMEWTDEPRMPHQFDYIGKDRDRKVLPGVQDQAAAIRRTGTVESPLPTPTPPRQPEQQSRRDRNLDQPRHKSDAEGLYETGSLKKPFHETRGFSFIEPDTGERDVFVHFSDVRGDHTRMRTGDRVRFRVEMTPKGLQARDVTLID